MTALIQGVLTYARISAGVSPDLAMYLNTFADQLKVMYWLSYARYAARLFRCQHSRLTPGEQYRQHIASGGYRC